MEFKDRISISRTYPESAERLGGLKVRGEENVRVEGRACHVMRMLDLPRLGLFFHFYFPLLVRFVQVLECNCLLCLSSFLVGVLSAGWELHSSQNGLTGAVDLAMLCCKHDERPCLMSFLPSMFLVCSLIAFILFVIGSWNFPSQSCR